MSSLVYHIAALTLARAALALLGAVFSAFLLGSIIISQEG